ncbi:MAG TPA: universal stress protein [Blastocatellia bacterium]|nr:universal stress protein [Blastocatellia bacterium]
MRILIAVDGSPCSDVAAEKAAKRPWPDDSEIKIISVVEPLPVTPMTETWTLPPDYFDQWERAVEDRAKAAIDGALAKFGGRKDKAVNVTSEILKGHARDVILDEAKRWHADLIIVGSHGYRGLKRLWLGSVSQAVASHAPCSVEIVRSPNGHTD